jgi:pyruvate dehydrogenase E2 component (dihydrolipoamide acetyltransferase)
MAVRVTLPREGSTTMASGVVLAWLVEVGEVVEAGTPLVEIEADKVSFEVVAPVGGTVLAQAAEVHEEVAIGGLLGWIGEAGEDAPAEDAAPAGPDAAAAPAITPAPAPARG